MTRPDEPVPKSFGNMSDAHWSRTRAGSNTEAIEYYRQRSLAPGVKEGGAERNCYCMECAGVIPFEHSSEACPHCGASLEGMARRYFNWVEINEPPASDLRALLPLVAGGAALLLLLAGLLWWLLR